MLPELEHEECDGMSDVMSEMMGVMERSFFGNTWTGEG
jgi:hypothetical protein